jgi:hypothetical protein
MSEALHGSVVDEYPHIHPDLLQRYHGIFGDPVHRDPSQVGAGYPSDEESDNGRSALRVRITPQALILLHLKLIQSMKSYIEQLPLMSM